MQLKFVTEFSGALRHHVHAVEANYHSGGCH